MGVAVTEGLGAGSQPEVGRAAAEEAIDEIIDHLSGSHMVFVTAGMGGGTGTGAAPTIARAARDQGILTVGVVTKPFHFEGARRMRVAEQGIMDLQACVDTLIVIPNQNLFRIANEKTTFADAFAMADQVLYSGVACITDLMVKEGLINLDFADVRSVMREMGKAMMGTGEASGDRRAIQAAEAAIANPLLDETSMKGAKGLLISITGGKDLTLFEVDEAATRIREEVDPDANIILGATFEESLEGVIRVSVVATGIDNEAREDSTPAEMRMAELSQRLRTATAGPSRRWPQPAGGSAASPGRRSRRRLPPSRSRSRPSAIAAASRVDRRWPGPRSRRRSRSRLRSSSRGARPRRHHRALQCRRPAHYDGDFDVEMEHDRPPSSRTSRSMSEAAVHSAAGGSAAGPDAAGRGLPAHRPAPDGGASRRPVRRRRIAGRSACSAASPMSAWAGARKKPAPRAAAAAAPQQRPVQQQPQQQRPKLAAPPPPPQRQPQQQVAAPPPPASDYAKRPPAPRAAPQQDGLYRPRQAELDKHGRPLPRDARQIDDELEIPAFLRRQAN